MKFGPARPPSTRAQAKSFGARDGRLSAVRWIESNNVTQLEIRRAASTGPQYSVSYVSPHWGAIYERSFRASFKYVCRLRSHLLEMAKS